MTAMRDAAAAGKDASRRATAVQGNARRTGPPSGGEGSAIRAGQVVRAEGGAQGGNAAPSSGTGQVGRRGEAGRGAEGMAKGPGAAAARAARWRCQAAGG